MFFFSTGFWNRTSLGQRGQWFEVIQPMPSELAKDANRIAGQWFFGLSSDEFNGGG